ncbi:unnamed protein product [Rhodiola kirilowii]
MSYLSLKSGQIGYKLLGLLVATFPTITLASVSRISPPFTISSDEIQVCECFSLIYNISEYKRNRINKTLSVAFRLQLPPDLTIKITVLSIQTKSLKSKISILRTSITIPKDLLKLIQK